MAEENRKKMSELPPQRFLEIKLGKGSANYHTGDLRTRGERRVAPHLGFFSGDRLYRLDGFRHTDRAHTPPLLLLSANSLRFVL